MRVRARHSVLFALALMAPSTVLAATLQVGTGLQYKKIQTAIDAASNGDTIEVASGTWKGALDLRGKSITIRSVSGRGATTIDGKGTSDGIKLLNGVGAGATIQGFTITNAGQRAILVENSTLKLVDVEIKNSGNVYLLGGAINQLGGTLIVEDSDFTNNDSCGGTDLYASAGAHSTFTRTQHTDGYGYFGGVAQTLDATVTLTDVEIDRPFSDLDGGAFHFERSTVTITNLDIDAASNAYGHGTAIAAKDNSHLTWTGGSITNSEPESTSGYYGAVYVTGGSSLVGSGILFHGNLGGLGGALAVTDGASADLSSCDFTDNDADYGGAIAVRDGGELTLDDAYLHGNDAAWDGGAIDGTGDVVVTVTDSEIDGNDALSGYGGGVHLYDGCDAEFSDTLFKNNTADDGGGFFVDSCNDAVPFLRADFDGNTATEGQGGHGYLTGATDASFIDSTFKNGQSQSDGGALFLEGGWFDGDRAEITLTGGSFEGNQAQGGGMGGAVYAGMRAYLTADGVTFDHNSATGEGGAVVKDYDGDLVLTNSTLDHNDADSDGGAVYIYSTLSGWAESANMTISGNTFVDNKTDDDGGAVAVLCSVDIDLSDNRFTENEAVDQGGALYLYYLGNQTLARNYVCGNSAASGGGAYSTNYYPGTDAWDDNWFVENDATGNGGGIYFYGAYSPVLTSTSAVGNSGALGGGIYLSSSYIDIVGGDYAYNDSGNGVHAKDNNSSLYSTFASANWFGNSPAHVGGYLTVQKITGNGNTTTEPFLPVTLDGACDDDPWSGPCPGAPDVDSDHDGMPDACDVCPAGSDVANSDGDGVADGCDACAIGDDLADSDNDGAPDACDVCPAGNNADDADFDGAPDACDVCPLDAADDSDGDGACDTDDECPFDPVKFEAGVCGCNGSDDDSDYDGVVDCNDTCSGEDDLLDFDLDGTPDGCDVCVGGDDGADADSDGVPDACDDGGGNPCGDGPEPLPCNPWGDTDGDGLGDTAEINLWATDMFDPDSDGDGLLDGDEVTVYGTDPTDSDTDGDAALDGAEVAAGTDPLVADVIPALDMAGVSPGLAGKTNTYTVVGGTPGQQVVVFMSTKTGSSAVTGCPDILLDMGTPNVVGTATVGADGTVAIKRFVGVAAAGKEYRVQAVEKVTCRLSDLELETF